MFVPDDIEILLCTEAIDMRKGADGLAGLVRDILQDEPLARKLFVFQSKRKDRVKILYWHYNGFAVWSKRIQRGKFNFPTGTAGGMTLRRTALRMILEGADLKSLSQQMRRTA
jgi:transposase